MKQSVSVQIEYKVIENGICIVRLHGRCAELRLPEVIEGKPVVAVAEGAFSTEAELLPDEEEREAEISFVTEAAEQIGEGQALRRIFLPQSVHTIGAHAFRGCSALEWVALPAGLEEISPRMFEGCSALERLTLPAHLKGIGDYAFYGCSSLKELHLPDGVEHIGKYAFYNCRKMEKTQA